MVFWLHTMIEFSFISKENTCDELMLIKIRFLDLCLDISGLLMESSLPKHHNYYASPSSVPRCTSIAPQWSLTPVLVWDLAILTRNVSTRSTSMV